MTKEQLDTIRALHAQGYGIFGTDLRALLDEVERLKAELDASDSDDRLAVKRLTAEVERLTAWQVAVADGLGYLNCGEGQGGYEIADPETVIGAWREQEREVERLKAETPWVPAVERAAFRRGAEAMRMGVLAEFEKWFLAKEPTVSFVRSLRVLRVDENKP